MILDLAKIGISQTQVLNLIDDLEQIDETLASTLCPNKPELTSDERMLFLTKLRSCAQQFNFIANKINLTHY